MLTSQAGRLARVAGSVTGRMDRLSDRGFALLLFIPGGVLVALFVLPPILAVIGMSLFRIELLRDQLHPFVGVGNYLRLLRDSELAASVPRTIVFGIGITLLTIPIAMFSALLVRRSFRGVTIVAIAVLLPWAVAPVVTGLFWKFIFQSHFGLATSALTVLGVTDKPIDWLFDQNTAVAIAIVATSWRGVPLFALLLLAALKTIPDVLYRAAKMDGANAWQTFRYVTLPSISSTLFAVTVLTVIYSLQVFDVLYTLTRGGPGRQTTVLNYYVYESITQSLSFGYGSATGLLLLSLIALASAALLVPRIRSRRQPSTGEIGNGSAAALVPEAFDPSHSFGAPSLHRPNARAPRRRRTLRIPAWAGRGLLVLAAGSLVLWLVGPILWIVISSFQSEGAITQVPPALSLGFRLDAYQLLLGDPAWLESIVVSSQVSIATMLLTLVLGSLAAYPLARLDVPGKGLITGFIVFSLMLPAIVIAIPTLLIFRALGLDDTVLGLVVVNVAFLLPLVVWLLRSIFSDVPRALESAARIDGCSRLGALFRVTIPAAAPGMSALAILLFVGTWNEFLFASVLGGRDTVTVTQRIGLLEGAGALTGPPPFTVLAAAGVIAIAPALLLVSIFHRRIVSGLTGGLVKG